MLHLPKKNPILKIPGLVLLACLLTALSSCVQRDRDSANPWGLIPASSDVVLQLHDVERFRSEYRNNGLLRHYREVSGGNRLFGVLDQVLELELGPGCLVAVTVDPGEDPRWLVVFEEVWQPVPDSVGAAGSSPVGTPADSSGLVAEKVGAIRLLSNSASLIAEAAGNETDSGNPLLQAARTANPRTSASLFLPMGHAHPLEAFLLGKVSGKPIAPGAAWSAFDLQLRSDALLFQGIEVRPDSLWDNRAILRGIPALPLGEVARVPPAGTSALYTLSLGDPGKFLQNQERILGRPNPHPGLLESVEHLGVFNLSGETLAVLVSVNPTAVIDGLRPQLDQLDSFQDAGVYALQDPAALMAAFDPLLKGIPEPGFLGAFGNYFVLGPSLEGVRNVISSYKREDSYAANGTYDRLQPFLASESTSFVLADHPGEAGFLTDSLSVLGLPEPIAGEMPSDYLYSAQLNSSEGYDLLEYQFRKKDDPTGSGASVSLAFTRKLEGQVMAGPFMLRNHRTGGMDLAVQDDRNQLYLYSASGDLYWKKELAGPIQGAIHQVDLFKNGRFQMAFTLPGALMVLDRDGNPVAPFPKKFEGGTLGPLALFDYDNNRNYRLVFNDGQKIYMFDGQGRDVSGFKFRDAGSPPIGPPDHIRIGSRDYLVFRLEDGRLRILNRVGDTRIRVEERFDFSGNGIYLYRDKFAFTEKSGNLVTIDTRGRINRTALNLNADHGMYATAHTLALMNDNVFQVKGNRAELELGVYTAPRIFYLYDIIYVGVTDIQTQKLYLFRSDASRLKGFPVEGNGLPDMADMDGDRNPELGVKFRDSLIAVYRIQR